MFEKSICITGKYKTCKTANILKTIHIFMRTSDMLEIMFKCKTYCYINNIKRRVAINNRNDCLSAS